MIPRSPWVAVLCVALAGTLHAAVALLPPDDAETLAVEGGGGASISTLGQSFADMAQGAAVPRPDMAAAPKPMQTPPPPVQPARAVETPPDMAPETRAMAALVPPPAARAPQPERATPVEAPAIAPAPSPEATAKAAPVPEPQERLTASPDIEAPHSSVRPKARPAPRKQPQASPEKRQRPKTTVPPQQPGNANRNAKAGTASGQEPPRKKAAGTGEGDSAQAGNAAAANYPGQVMRRIQRTPRERVNLHGSAQVSFTVAPNGGLAALGIARSSGSERLDRVALQQIRRAAPFPPPPPGARRSFTLRIDGR